MLLAEGQTRRKVQNDLKMVVHIFCEGTIWFLNIRGGTIQSHFVPRYISVPYLSAQSMKNFGKTPTYFKHLKQFKNRIKLEKV